jgi:hypothetical protein
MFLRLFPMLMVCTVVACSHAAPAGMRLQLRTVADWPDAAALAARVAQVTALPVRDATGIAPRLFALTLDCVDEAACAAARARLLAERSLIESVHDDRRIPSPSRPAASTAR